MQEVDVESWDAFERRLSSRYVSLPLRRRNQLIFRGHASSDWLLQPTLDRASAPQDESSRTAMLAQLLHEFKRNAYGLPFELGMPDTPRQWELLARHHGLPTTILDWTTSPYIAAFFAYEAPTEAENVAIFVFDRAFFEQDRTGEDPIEILDEIEDYRYNIRAIEQEGVFMKSRRVASLEDELHPYLWKYVLPSLDRSEVLARLATMRVNARTLFRDLDRAAMTAVWNVLEGAAT